MILETGAITLGILVSFFLKNINFLGLDLKFLDTGLIYPDFLLIFLIYFALTKGEFAGIWIGFFSGLLEDSGLFIFSDRPEEFISIIGMHALIYTLTGFILGKLNRFIDRGNALPQMVLVLVTTYFTRVFIWIIMGIADDFYKSYPFVGPALYTALVSPIWFTLLGWLYRFSTEEAK